MDDDAIRDLFSGLGPVTIRRMFGGKGIYHDGAIFALEVNGDLLLKADAESVANFIEAGCRQWVYQGHKGRGPVAMPYWSIPESAMDDPDEMTLWARRAFGAGLRSRKS
ncbi:TfoX/Sxy family protein [Nitratireductor kimnyeongensis]|uniref:TfoX/Sxy family protein n=1 Tax=Nitratireductor kimnyeongensis TaxID=430679 RepID=A0ABW0T973_9HYPH|nr:TfoX/Sxy family protein [Nitratireductor kimnyeongensis]QZZ35618.1 TfoX/Sxy family protein [Nitratireductor kimnyeongensis]